MKFTCIKLLTLIGDILYQYMHASPAKTLALLVYACIETKSALISAWAEVLATIKSQPLKNCKFVIWRFLKESVFNIKQAYAGIINFLLRRLPLHMKILVCMDWTDVRVFKVLALGLVIESIGTSIPLYIKAIRKDMSENEMTYFEQEMLQSFFSVLDLDVRRRIIILADRGFAKGDLFKLITSYQAHFIIRLPKIAYVRERGSAQWIALSELAKKTAVEGKYNRILYSKEHAFPLNIIIRHVVPQEEEEEEQWILGTDEELDIEQACQYYSRRMRIEETFRVMKSQGFNCEQIRCQNEDTFNKTMLVLALSYMVVITFYWKCDNGEEIQFLTIKRKKEDMNEHSEFQIALRWLKKFLRREGITTEGIYFIQEYLLIHTKERRVVHKARFCFPSSA